MTEIGYVVLEHNQAGGPATLPEFSDIHSNRDDAEDDKTWRENMTAQAGRRETYQIAIISKDEDE